MLYVKVGKNKSIEKYKYFQKKSKRKWFNVGIKRKVFL